MVVSCVVGRACRGPSPGERSRPELLDMEPLNELRGHRVGGSVGGGHLGRRRAGEFVFYGASRTRTGDHLGAIQALASPEFGLFAGISLWWRLGVRLAFSASFRSFRLGSGQRSKGLADPRFWRGGCP